MMMTQPELEQMIRDQYSLTDQQIQKATRKIINALSKFASPSDQPLVVVVGGQSGSGKTALIDYTAQMSSKRKFVQIDNDYFRSFHPKEAEIRAKYPDYFTIATDQLGLGITADIIEYFKSHRYNIILHQTMKSNRIVDDAITKFIDAGYTVGVRTFAVPYFESKMSQIERCEEQLKFNGCCRHVSQKDHDTAILGLPQTIAYLEQTGKYDFIEVFKRGERIDQPEVVYAQLNEKNKHHTLAVLTDCQKQLSFDRSFEFTSAHEAVEKTRQSEAIKCAKTLDARIQSAEQNPYNNFEMQLHIDELKERLAEFRNTHKLRAIAIKTPFTYKRCKDFELER